jgi:hypothetical protein
MSERKSIRPAEQIGVSQAFSKARGGVYWHVELYRNGKKFQKDFFEKRCGGTQNALRLAQAWRDAIIAKHPPMSMAQFCFIARANNTSGVPGVYRSAKSCATKNGHASAGYWQARIPLGHGKYRFAAFSVTLLGEETARQRAIEARLHGLGQLEHVVFREGHQPRPVSSNEDAALLAATLRESMARRARRAAERVAKQKHDELRVAEAFARARAAEQKALHPSTNRSGEPYIGRYKNSKGTGQYWRVSFVRQGKRHRQAFSDKKYGSADEALPGHGFR